MSRRRPGSRHYQALNAARWRHARNRVLERDGWRCQAEGCSVAGRLEVDHKRPMNKHLDLDPYDLANLQTLCRSCHIEKTRVENRRPLTSAEARWRGFVQEALNS